IRDEGVIEGRRWKSLFTDLVDHEREMMGGMGPFERTFLKEKPGTKEWLRRLCKGVDDGHACVRGGIIIPFASGAATSQFESPEGQPSANPSSHTAVNTTNVETNLWVPGIWTPIPANSMMAG